VEVRCRVALEDLVGEVAKATAWRPGEVHLVEVELYGDEVLIQREHMTARGSHHAIYGDGHVPDGIVQGRPAIEMVSYAIENHVDRRRKLKVRGEKHDRDLHRLATPRRARGWFTMAARVTRRRYPAVRTTRLAAYWVWAALPCIALRDTAAVVACAVRIAEGSIRAPRTARLAAHRIWATDSVSTVRLAHGIDALSIRVAGRTVAAAGSAGNAADGIQAAHARIAHRRTRRVDALSIRVAGRTVAAAGSAGNAADGIQAAHAPIAHGRTRRVDTMPERSAHFAVFAIRPARLAAHWIYAARAPGTRGHALWRSAFIILRARVHNTRVVVACVPGIAGPVRIARHPRASARLRDGHDAHPFLADERSSAGRVLVAGLVEAAFDVRLRHRAPAKERKRPSYGDSNEATYNS